MARHKSPDRQKKSRNVMSFFIYVFVALFSLSCCGILSIANSKTVADVFTNYSYVESLKADVQSYANDRCLEASVPNDFVNKSFDYNTIHQLQEAYIYSELDVSNQYNADAFDALMATFEESLNEHMQDMIDEQGITTDSKASRESFCKDIAKFTRGKIEFKFITELKSIVKRVRLLSYATAILSAIMLIILGAILIKKGGKNYRITRSFSYSFLAGFIFNFVLVIAGLLVKATKDLVIFPSYLADAFMKYYNSSLLSVTYAGAVLLLISIVLAAFTWKFKRQERE